MDVSLSNTVTEGQWLACRELVREFLAEAKHLGWVDVVALISNQVRILAEFSHDGSLPLEVLTLANVEMFLERLRVGGRRWARC